MENEPDSGMTKAKKIPRETERSRSAANTLPPFLVKVIPLSSHASAEVIQAELAGLDQAGYDVSSVVANVYSVLELGLNKTVTELIVIAKRRRQSRAKKPKVQPDV